MRCRISRATEIGVARGDTAPRNNQDISVRRNMRACFYPRLQICAKRNQTRSTWMRCAPTDPLRPPRPLSLSFGRISLLQPRSRWSAGIPNHSHRRARARPPTVTGSATATPPRRPEQEARPPQPRGCGVAGGKRRDGPDEYSVGTANSPEEVVAVQYRHTTNLQEAWKT